MTLIVQQKPDFSGDWTLNRQASTLSPAAAAFQSGVMRIEHHEPIFRCEATYVADGKPVGIEWTSSNMNRPWFGGSQWIPNTDNCKGNAWRALIIDGLNQASVGAC